MSKYKYTEDLKKHLAEYGKILKRMKQDEKRKNELKDSFKKWLKINDLSDIVVRDTDNTSWSVILGSRTKNNLDRDKLKQILSEEKLKECYTSKEENFFYCQPLDESSKTKGSGSRPSAPTEVD